MEQSTISYGESTVSFHFIKRGPGLVVCFHGYDETGASFEILKDLLPERQSLLAIDLPYHGDTLWQPGRAFDVQSLWAIVDTIRKLHFPESESLELMGFSLGGRLALGMMESAPVTISRLVLIAPDGVKVNPWYWLATRSIVGRWLFRYTINHPGWLMWGLKWGIRLRVINQSIYKFTIHYLGTADLRRQLYDRWMTMRFVHPNITATVNNIIRGQVPVTLIYGSYDRIMPPGKGRNFCRKLGKLCHLIVLACGHQILQPKNKKHLFKIFQEHKSTGE